MSNEATNVRQSQDLGFLLLTHENPLQIQQLIDCLGRLFCNPPIVLHHDFSKCQLDCTVFPNNVGFVDKWQPTKWGEFSLVEATLRGLDALFSSCGSLTWAIFLSGSDYPIKPAAVIREELFNSGSDCFLEHQRVHSTMPRNNWQIEFAKRYLRVVIPGTRRQVPFAKIPLPDNLLESFSVFGEDRHCYGGSQWFSIRRSAADYLLRAHHTHSDLRRFYSGVPMADESYIHTLLGNNPDLTIVNDHKRYFQWGDGGHNTTLTVADFPRLRSCSAHFARKVSFNATPELKACLDALIGIL